MSKYLFLVKTQLSQIGAYRTDLVFTWIYRLFQMLVVYALWSVTQKTAAELERLFIYYALFFLFFDSIANSRIAKWMSKDIRRGDMNTYLLKPLNYPTTLWIKKNVIVIARLIIPTLIFVVFSFVRPDIVAPHSPVHFIVFIVATIACTVLWDMFTTIIGLLSFWINEVAHLQNVTNLLLNIVNGRYIPIYLFPFTVKRILDLTPVSYLGSFQIQIYQGFIEPAEILKGFCVMAIWTLIFLLIARSLYSRGIRIYEANGS